MLAVGAGESRLTDTVVSVHFIIAGSSVLTRIAGAVINVDIAFVPSPPRLTDTIVPEELVHTHSADTRVVLAQVNLGLTPLSRESGGAGALIVIHQVSTVATQKAGLLQTVINVLVTVPSGPSWWASAGVSSLGQGPTGRSVAAGVALLVARVLRHIAVVSLVTITAKALKVVGSWKVLAHGPVGTDAFSAVRYFVLALEASEALRTDALVALRQVNTLGSIEARS